MPNDYIREFNNSGVTFDFVSALIISEKRIIFAYRVILISLNCQYMILVTCFLITFFFILFNLILVLGV